MSESASRSQAHAPHTGPKGGETRIIYHINQKSGRGNQQPFKIEAQVQVSPVSGISRLKCNNIMVIDLILWN
jgi:hypothetical protein